MANRKRKTIRRKKATRRKVARKKAPGKRKISRQGRLNISRAAKKRHAATRRRKRDAQRIFNETLTETVKDAEATSNKATQRGQISFTPGSLSGDLVNVRRRLEDLQEGVDLLFEQVLGIPRAPSSGTEA